MQKQSALEGRRRLLFSAIAGALLIGSVAACAPVPMTVDNPKGDSVIQLVPEQKLRVRLTNPGPVGRWEMQPADLKSIKATGAEVQAASAGALQLELFDFEGVSPGTDTLTFVKRVADAAPGAQDEGYTFTVTVK